MLPRPACPRRAGHGCQGRVGEQAQCHDECSHGGRSLPHTLPLRSGAVVQVELSSALLCWWRHAARPAVKPAVQYEEHHNDDHRSAPQNPSILKEVHDTSQFAVGTVIYMITDSLTCHPQEKPRRSRACRLMVRRSDPCHAGRRVRRTKPTASTHAHPTRTLTCSFQLAVISRILDLRSVGCLRSAVQTSRNQTRKIGRGEGS